MKAGFVKLFSITLVEDNLPAIQRICRHGDRSTGRTSQVHLYYQAMLGSFALMGNARVRQVQPCWFP
jgi:hypothetical protein